jgi:hypothetical protein
MQIPAIKEREGVPGGKNYQLHLPKPGVFRTSGITGSRPSAPVPTTSRRQRHGISSSIETGVWPNLSRYRLDVFFLRFRISELPWV